jgi:hypothetical protein
MSAQTPTLCPFMVAGGLNVLTVPRSSSVVIVCLEKINTVSTHQIPKAMLLSQQVRLHAGTKILHRFTPG